MRLSNYIWGVKQYTTCQFTNYHSSTNFGHVIYALQTCTYRNIVKLFNSLKYLILQYFQVLREFIFFSIDTFWTNPQFRVTLTDVDDDDDDDLCTLIIGLLQKDRRKKRKEGVQNLTIGYMIYKVSILRMK